MRRIVVPFAFALGIGCSAASPAADKNDGRDAGSSPGDSADASIDHARPPKPPCSAPPEDRPPGGTCVLEARGAVTDLAGAPLADLLVTMCGRTCFGSHSDATGHFVVPVGDFVDRENYAIHVDGRPDHADNYIRLAKGDSQTIELASPLLLPSLPAAGPLLPPDKAAASVVTSGDLTLGIADGTVFDLPIEDFANGDAGRMLRVALVPVDKSPDFAHVAKVEAIYAIAPAGTKSSAKMAVTLPNAASIPAGAAVELLVLGDDYVSTPPTVGIMSVDALAHVSADGKTIATDPGEGIGEINWLGVRRKGN